MSSLRWFCLRLAALLTGCIILFASGTPTALAQNCQDFANRQIQLADKLVEKNEFSGALRALDVAAKDCDTEGIREKVASVIESWHRYVSRRGSASLLSQFIQVVSSQSNVPSDQRWRVDRRLVQNTTSLIKSMVENERYDRAHRYCSAYSRYSDRTFELNYYCGVSARQSRAYSDAISSYEWLMDNWEEDQELTTRDSTSLNLQILYLRTTRFERAYEMSKRLAQQDPTPKHLLAAVMAVRGKMMEPIIRTAQVLFDGATPSRSVRHAQAEMKRIGFPHYVESLYVLNAAGMRESAIYGSSAIKMPSDAAMDRASSDAVTLLYSASDMASSAWMVAPVDGSGRLVLQFGSDTVSDENVLLETLRENTQSDDQWQRLRSQQHSLTATATGSAVATLLGSTYLGGGSVGRYDDVFDTLPTLAYYCVQDESSSIVASYQFDRSAIGYSDQVWRQSSETPALYHHEVAMNETPLREVVWPTYDEEQWSGVIRIGIVHEHE